MKRDDIKKLLGEEVTEEQISSLLNAFHEKDSENKKEIEQLQKQLNQRSDYDDLKKQLDDINKANMTEQEKLEEMKKETELNLKNSRIIVNTAKAKEILAGENIDEDLIASIVSDDLETTISKANKFKDILNNLKSSVEKQTRENLATQDLKPSITNVPQDDGAMTIDKFNDLTAEEQDKFIEEHPDEFEKL